jgi:adenylate cyclase
MKKTLSFLLILTMAIGLQAQMNLDSLFNAWEDVTLSDSLRARAYHDYIWNGFLFSQPDSAFVLAEELVRFGQNSSEYPKAEVNALNIQGSAFWFKGNYTQARVYFNKILEIQNILKDQSAMGTTLNNIGITYQIQDNYIMALEFYNRSLKIREEIRDTFGVASTLHNIAGIHIDQEDYPRALTYVEKSLKLNQEINQVRGVSSSYTHLGLIYQYQKEYQKALGYHRRSLEIDKKLGHQNGVANSYGNIGFIKGEMNEYDSALILYKKALEIHETIGNQKGTVTSLINIGLNHSRQGEYKEALENCEKGYDLANSMGVLEEQKNACVCIYDAYKGLNNAPKALEYHELLLVLSDSMINTENTKKLTELEMQYAFDKKEAAKKAEQDIKDAAAAKELQRQRLVRNVFIGGFAFVLLFAGVFFKQRNNISKEKAISEELLLNILPEEVAAELKEKGQTEAQLLDDVTVLFTDFKGFTALSEKLSPKELVQDLHDCFSLFDNICEKYGIEKIKTIGDAYMAAGGLPSPNATHAVDVVNAALEMAEIVEQGKKKKLDQGLPFFEIRIGVHTGPVVAGIVGVKKFQYDIWGDTVNTASRMESSGAVGKVNISATIQSILKDDPAYTFIPRGKIMAKGKGEMEMYFVSKDQKPINF